MSGAPKPAPAAHAESHGDEGAPPASHGPDRKFMLMAGVGGGVGAFITGLVIVALLAPAKPAPPPPPEPPPAPPVMEASPVDLPEIVVKAQHDGRLVALALRISLEMQTKGSALIIQSRLPAFQEAFTISAERLLAASGTAISADDLKQAATKVANEILSHTKCSDLAAATAAQGCTPGSEFPVGSAFIRNIMAY